MPHNGIFMGNKKALFKDTVAPSGQSGTNHKIIRANLEIIFVRITMLYFSVTRCVDTYKERELNWIQLGLLSSCVFERAKQIKRSCGVLSKKY